MGTPKIHNVSKSQLQDIGHKIITSNKGDSIHLTTDGLDEYKHGTIVETDDDTEDYYVLQIQLDCGEIAQVYANWRDIPPSATDQETPYLGFIASSTKSKNAQITDLYID